MAAVVTATLLASVALVAAVVVGRRIYLARHLKSSRNLNTAIEFTNILFDSLQHLEENSDEKPNGSMA